MLVREIYVICIYIYICIFYLFLTKFSTLLVLGAFLLFKYVHGPLRRSPYSPTLQTYTWTILASCGKHCLPFPSRRLSLLLVLVQWTVVAVAVELLLNDDLSDWGQCHHPIAGKD